MVSIDHSKCIGCGACVKECAANAIRFVDIKLPGHGSTFICRPVINQDECINCMTCQEACLANAIKA